MNSVVIYGSRFGNTQKVAALLPGELERAREWAAALAEAAESATAGSIAR